MFYNQVYLNLLRFLNSSISFVMIGLPMFYLVSNCRKTVFFLNLLIPKFLVNKYIFKEY